uniref:Uncharacterized protein n=1 Tax=Anopheles christyi TaxID=43041 RepID=A0A182KJ49_9DIPT
MAGSSGPPRGINPAALLLSPLPAPAAPPLPSRSGLRISRLALFFPLHPVGDAASALTAALAGIMYRRSAICSRTGTTTRRRTAGDRFLYARQDVLEELVRRPADGGRRHLVQHARLHTLEESHHTCGVVNFLCGFYQAPRFACTVLLRV